MKKLPRILLLLLLSLFSSISLVSCKKETVAASIPPPQPTQVYSKDGISINSYDFKAFESFLKMQNDTTYVVNFWATWCQPCVEELPNFEKLNAEYQSQKVKVILVSLDMRKQVESNLIPFVQKRNLKSQVIHLSDSDANAWISKVDSAWSGAIPATVIYKKNKRKFYEQSFSFDQLKGELAQFN